MSPHAIEPQGFYSKSFSRGEREALSALLAEGLQDEVAMLRVSIRRVFSLTDPSADLPQGEQAEVAMRALNTLSQACSRLGYLLQLESKMGGGSSIGEAITMALEQVIADLGVP